MGDFEPTLDPSLPMKCDRYYTENNRTTFIYGGYEGIPENLLINFIVWMVSSLHDDIITSFPHYWPFVQGIFQSLVDSLHKESVMSNPNVFSKCRQLEEAFQWTVEIFISRDLSDGLVQERRNSIADALELRLSCTNPSSWCSCDVAVMILCISKIGFCFYLRYGYLYLRYSQLASSGNDSVIKFVCITLFRWIIAFLLFELCPVACEKGLDSI